MEPDRYSSGTTVISFPIEVQYAGRRKSEVPLPEKVDLAAQMQRYWSDNQVSCTAEFDPDSEAKVIPRILEAYEDRLKGISFLPAAGHSYEQPPYEEISEQEYKTMQDKLRPLDGEVEFLRRRNVRISVKEADEKDVLRDPALRRRTGSSASQSTLGNQYFHLPVVRLTIKLVSSA